MKKFLIALLSLVGAVAVIAVAMVAGHQLGQRQNNDRDDGNLGAVIADLDLPVHEDLGLDLPVQVALDLEVPVLEDLDLPVHNIQEVAYYTPPPHFSA